MFVTALWDSQPQYITVRQGDSIQHNDVLSNAVLYFVYQLVYPTFAVSTAVPAVW